jgi:AcrR family transcriptional regulator
MTRSDARGHRRDEERALRRAQLLDDAVEAIREVGSGATMEQLARRGGVTKPILYRHFGDRDGLIKAIAQQFSTQLFAEIQAALHNTDDPKELLEQTIDAYIGFIDREPALYRFLLQQIASPSTGLVQMSPLIDSISREVAIVIGEQLRAAGLDSGGAVPWAYGIVGLVHQAGDWWLDDRTMPRARLTGYLTALLWGGLSTPAAEAGTAPAT